MKTKIILFLFSILILTSCADVADVKDCVPSDPYGFWSGLWHGWIIMISWVGSLFSDDIAVYAVNNNGGWYDFGFILGVGGIGATAGRSTKK